MEIRFYNDPATGLPHIYEHGVTEEEVRDVLLGSGEDIPAKRGARMKVGQTSGGQFLQIIYVPEEDPRSVFVITTYELHGKAKSAYRWRQRRKGR